MERERQVRQLCNLADSSEEAQTQGKLVVKMPALTPRRIVQSVMQATLTPASPQRRDTASSDSEKTQNNVAVPRINPVVRRKGASRPHSKKKLAKSPKPENTSRERHQTETSHLSRSPTLEALPVLDKLIALK